VAEEKKRKSQTKQKEETKEETKTKAAGNDLPVT
jgi:hypothetical protein